MAYYLKNNNLRDLLNRNDIQYSYFIKKNIKIIEEEKWNYSYEIENNKLLDLYYIIIIYIIILL